MRETKITFSKKEITDLIKAWALVSIAFGILYAPLSEPLQLLFTIFAAAITAGLGFALHELAHKVVAIRFGCSAEFRANMLWLYIGLGMALLLKAIFLAPGAVLVRGVQSKAENGIISAAGPATNIVLGFAFLAVNALTQAGWWTFIFTLGAIINSWLAVFNLIPILPFDGAKVWLWSKPIYIGMTVVSVSLLAYQFLF